MSPRRSARTTGERGSATVETALVLPVIVMMLAALLVTALAGVQQLSVTEGARAAARALAIGHSPEQARTIAQRVCQCAADITVSEGAWVQVHVRSTSRSLSWLPGLRVSTSVTLPAEPGGSP